MKIISLITLAIISTTPLFGDEDHTKDQNDAALAFSISGLKIGMTMDQVKALGFSLVDNPPNSDVEGEVTAYSVDNAPNVDVLIIEFFKGTVFEAYAYYLPSTLEKIGGWGTLYDRVTAKIGPSEEDPTSAKDKEDASWQFYSINRFFGLSVSDNESARLDVADKEASRAITALKASKAKVGF
jgi:hypothetical protein